MKLRVFLLFLAAVGLFGREQDARQKPKVEFTTSLGSFIVELEPDAAPKTVENFLEYVNSGFYKDTTFHRIISTFMIQGGGFDPDGTQKTTTKKPVANEAKQAFEKGLTNVRGALAMARTSAPDSATTQFFINVVDNPRLDYPAHDGAGYCVFGRVTDGMDTIDKIRDVKTNPNNNKPLEAVVITDARLLGDPVAQKTRPAKSQGSAKK
ncbi:MAG: peptidylprolyl isomerase [Holophagales bacterium]|nr:peptidylprolyl isomerase [Holophagales bacterium]